MIGEANAATSPLTGSDSVPPQAGEPLLVADRVVVEYPGKGWRATPARVLHGVSLDVHAGETVGLVGESGSGKTTLGRAVLGLVPVADGEIRFGGRPISRLSKRERRAMSKDIQVVFQDPYSSLNPAMTVQDILVEPLIAAGASTRDARQRIRTLLDSVHIPKDADHRLPREFSGGQRQRIAIARALCRDPKLIVCDEPVSALDLSTQARVLDLFIEIQERTDVAYLFVSHDLSVVRHISDRVAVMYRGEIVESGRAEVITRTPQNPYTQKLLLASPVADPEAQAERRATRHRLIAEQTAGGGA